MRVGRARVGRGLTLGGQHHLVVVLNASADLREIARTDADGRLILSGSADLRETSRLDAGATLVLTGNADLREVARLDAGATLVISGSADLREVGRLDAVLLVKTSRHLAPSASTNERAGGSTVSDALWALIP